MEDRALIAVVKRSRVAERLLCMVRFLLVAALGAPVCLPGTVSDQLARQVEEHYNRTHSLSVRFLEKYQIQGHTRPAESGKLTLRKQGKMRWDYVQPAGKVLISDGKTVYLYTSGDNRVEKIPIRDTEDMRAPLAFLLGHLDFKKEFRNLQTRPGEGGTWLEAAAKSDQTPYAAVNMLVERDGSVRQLKVVGRDGSSMSFSFSDEILDPPVDDKLFQFKVPPGAEVVDAVELQDKGK